MVISLLLATLFLIGVISLLLDKRGQAPLFAMQFLLVILVVGFRHQLGVDWVGYRDLYEGRPVAFAVEPGYMALQYMFALADIPFWVFVFFVSFVFYASLFAFTWVVSPYPVLAIALFSLSSILFVVEALRQQLAVSIVLIAFLLGYRSFARYALLVVGAALFHISALAVLPLWVIARNNYLQKIGVGAFFVLLPLVLAGVSVLHLLSNLVIPLASGQLLGKLAYYMQVSSNIITPGFLFKVALVSFLFFVVGRLINLMGLMGLPETRYAPIVVAGTIIMALLDVILYHTPTISVRMRNYFLPLYTVLITYLFVARPLYKRFAIAIFFGLYLSYSFYGFYRSDVYQDHYADYDSYLYEVVRVGAGNTFQRELQVQEFWRTRKCC